jgi:solute carrier family 13 (sodium-dependent dicarboxylate transporter), member 2/3/5
VNDDVRTFSRKSIVPAFAVVAVSAIAVGATLGIADPKLARAAIVAGVVLVLWLTELLPLYATTMVLWVGCVLLLSPLDPTNFALPRVLSTAASPVMALFFGGFALSAAGSKYGIDGFIAGWMVRFSGGTRAGLLLTIMMGTAVLSMWMSNIAAGAMMVATLRPLFGRPEDQADDGGAFRRALLLGVAFAADFGGIGTPIGTGPNLIAIGAVEGRVRITFLQWMMFGVPMAALMIAVTFGLLVWLHGVRGRVSATGGIEQRSLDRRGWLVVVIFFCAVAGWLTEPLHGVPAALVALAIAAALFGTRLLDTSDLARLEWDTLLLVAGGLTLGHLFDASGLAVATASAVDWNALHPAVFLFALLLASALISAIASNTAAAAMLIQIALGIAPSPATAVLVALGASMGVPFVISTPPNSMVYGKGGLSGRDFFVPGIALMVLGCALLTVAGPRALRWVGIP